MNKILRHLQFYRSCVLRWNFSIVYTYNTRCSYYVVLKKTLSNSHTFFKKFLCALGFWGKMYLIGKHCSVVLFTHVSTNKAKARQTPEPKVTGILLTVAVMSCRHLINLCHYVYLTNTGVHQCSCNSPNLPAPDT